MSRTQCGAREILDSPAALFSVLLMNRKARQDRETYLGDALQKRTGPSSLETAQHETTKLFFLLSFSPSPVVLFSSIVARTDIYMFK